MTMAQRVVALKTLGSPIWWIFGVHWPVPGSPEVVGPLYPRGYKPDLLLTADGFGLLRLKPDFMGENFTVMPVLHPKDGNWGTGPHAAAWGPVGQHLLNILGPNVKVGSVITWRRLRAAIKTFAAENTWAVHCQRHGITESVART
jgi:hypothetical protein